VAATDLVRKLALGVKAGHDLGIVHRDLKPANVLFDAGGEPKITDFGLAKRGGAADLTRTGVVMGTPAYMAPEQARGQTKFVGPAADVHALGVILFECLTGHVPFAADDAVGLLMAVAEDEAPSVRRFARHVSKDLDRVVHKCLAKNPRDRYESAGELAEDLECAAAGEPPRHVSTGRFGQVFGALGKGRHADLTRYANLFLASAGLLIVTHSLNGLVALGRLPDWVGTAAFITRVVGLPILLAVVRRADPRPVTRNEWVLWSVWGGTFSPAA
jgi:serine/threonine protein kinase